MGKRKEAEQFIITYVEKIAPGIGNKEIYTKFFKTLSDEQFDIWIKEVNEGRIVLPIFIPQEDHSVTDTKSLLKVAEELGHEFFQYLWIKNAKDRPDHRTTVKHMVIDLPVKRASQVIEKKISVPPDNKTIDILTQQPTGDSKGAKISYPELLVLSSMGMDKSVEELIKVRGGDPGAYKAFSGFLSRYGRVNLDVINAYQEGVASKRTLKSYLLGAHLKVDL